MAKLRSSSSSSSSGSGKKKMMKLNSLAEKLQKRLSLVRAGRSASSAVPEDVKEGHFAVTAVDGTRFVVPLTFLGHPTFRRLLEMAAEEYGFDRRGALTLPCRPADLHCILASNWAHHHDSINWSAYSTNNANNNMVHSY